jgi:hypothetical protein
VDPVPGPWPHDYELVSTVGPMVAIALGVLCAYPLMDSAERVVRRVRGPGSP